MSYIKNTKKKELEKFIDEYNLGIKSLSDRDFCFFYKGLVKFACREDIGELTEKSDKFLRFVINQIEELDTIDKNVFLDCIFRASRFIDINFDYLPAKVGFLYLAIMFEITSFMQRILDKNREFIKGIEYFKVGMKHINRIRKLNDTDRLSLFDAILSFKSGESIGVLPTDSEDIFIEISGEMIMSWSNSYCTSNEDCFYRDPYANERFINKERIFFARNVSKFLEYSNEIFDIEGDK